MAFKPSTAEVPVIQVLEKEHYFTQALVPLPSAIPYPPLATSSLRLRTKVLALTANNFTYAKLGFLFHWWDVYPLPPSTPAPYTDATNFGRLSAWGWAEVLESTHASVPTGSLIWGYQPIGTLAQDLAVRDGSVPGQVIVTSESRQQLMPIYNRYFTAIGASADSLKRDIDHRADGPAHDALVRIMFETAYLMNRYMLGAPVTPPSAIPGTAPWTPDQADVKGATLIVLAPGSKLGLCFARELRHSRKEQDRIGRLVGAASEYSKPFVQGTGLYDAVVATTDSPVETLTKLGAKKQEKVVLVNFGGRAGAGAAWATALQPVYQNLLILDVGSEVVEVPQADVLAGFQAGGGGSTLVNANDLQQGAIDFDGEARYFENLENAWNLVRQEGLKGVKLRWGTGMDDVEKGWSELARGEVQSDEGRVFVL